MKKTLLFAVLLLSAYMLQAQTSTLFATGFSGSYGLAFDTFGNLYVSSFGDNAVSKVDPDGTIVNIYTGFNGPVRLAFDTLGYLYVANAFPSTVSKVDASGTIIATYTGFNYPTGLAFDSEGNLYVSNANTNTVSKVDASGNIVATYTGFQSPGNLVIDASDNLYVANTLNSTVNKVDATGNIVATYTGFNYPSGLTLDNSGNLFISNFSGHSISLIPAGSEDGTVAKVFITGLLYNPYMINYYDNALYVSDGSPNVYKITGGVLNKTHRYVKLDATGINDGSSWENAYTDLQTAIENSIGGDSIFVATTVTPYQAPVGTSYTMKEGVKIFGGFAGTEAAFSDRDIANKATLQGNGNRVITNNNNGLSPAAVLDGFIISGGDPGSGSGGGMYNVSASPTIVHCIFSDNHADGTDNGTGGGGICNDKSSPIITNCVFTGNTTATSGTVYYGGAIYNAGSDVTHHSNPIITNCTFTGNSTTKGGAICNANYSVCTVYNCTFSGNTATNIGGAVYTSTNAVFFSANCLFSGNTATTGAGAIQTTSGASATITNGTFSGNQAPAASYIVSGTMLTNCIIWGNSSSALTGSPIVTYSDIEGGYTGTGNMNADPLFANAPGAGAAPFTDGDYTLHSGSPAINTGTPDTTGLHIGNTDLAATARVVGSAIDMGAYESTGTPLPVKLISFTGKLQNGIADLQWQTGVETNFDYFELQKGSGGNLFTTSANIMAKGDNSCYSATVPQIGAKAYYRLKMVNHDGEFKYSKVIELSHGSLGNPLVYPNPAKDYINVVIASECIMNIYNATGLLVKSVLLQAGLNKIDIHALSAGIYFAKVNSIDVKFIKQ